MIVSPVVAAIAPPIVSLLGDSRPLSFPETLPAADRAALVAWYDGSAYTLASGKASVILDRSGNGNDLAASATASARSTPRAADLHLNRMPSLYCETASSQFLGTAPTAALFKFLHTFATGCTQAGVFIADGAAAGQQYAGSFNGTSADVTYGAFYNGSAETFSIFLTNGATNIVPLATVAAIKGRRYAYVFRAWPDGTYELRVDGVVIASAMRSGAPSSADPTYPLRLGQYGGAGAAPFGGHHGAHLFFNAPLSTAGLAALEAQLALYTNPSILADTAVVPGASQLAGTIKVFCLGDSITEGKTGASVYVGGYRGRLWSLVLADGRFAIDFVGPVADVGFADDHHDGRSGSKILDHYTGGTWDVASYFGVGQPYDDAHVVILGPGKNNTYNTEAVYAAHDNARDYFNLASRIQALSTTPKRFVFLNVTPQDNTVTGVQRRQGDSLNNAIGRGVLEWRVAGGICGFADVFTAVGPSGVATDHLHLNDPGYSSEGDEVFRVLKCVAGWTP